MTVDFLSGVYRYDSNNNIIEEIKREPYKKKVSLLEIDKVEENDRNIRVTKQKGSEKAIEAANTMTIPAQTGNNPNDVTYFSFDKYDIANPDALQVPHDASVRASFDTKLILDDIHIPKNNWNQGNELEPFTKSYPDYGSGGATQAITKSKIKLDEVVQLPKIK